MVLAHDLRFLGHTAASKSIPSHPMPCTVQISLDLPTIDDALHVAQIAADAGVGWLEAGTSLMVMGALA